MRRPVTIQRTGVNPSKIIQRKQYVLEIFGTGKQWFRYCDFGEKGVKMGRGERTQTVPELRTMAVRHFELIPEPSGSELIIHDLDSLNGVFYKISRPQPLANGDRFRIGQYLIDFRIPAPIPEVDRASRDGEILSSLDPLVHGCLVFVRPNGQPGLKYPLTKTETILGQEREGANSSTDIHLPADLTSMHHARITFRNGRHTLQNLSETDGTFFKIQGSGPIRPGDEFLAGEVMFRVRRAHPNEP
jgi:pSer/pThr/pTyr-binding forkhead associated (FHA) protein